MGRISSLLATRRGSLLPTGLRWRLTAWVAAVMLASAAVLFVVVYQDTGSQIRGQIDRSLSSNVNQLAQALRSARGGAPTRISAAADAYLRAQPYTASSTLLFVLVLHAPTASNHPEVFGGPPELGESIPEQGEENHQGARLLHPRLGYSVAHVPDVGRMRMYARALDIGGARTEAANVGSARIGALNVRGTRVVVAAAQPLTLVASAQHDVARAFLLAGIAVLLLALLASYLAGSRVSAPLRRMAGVAARVDAGELDPRMELEPGRADEVRVLAESFNHMLDRLAEAFASQREFIADASHELRTPLTVIRGQLEVLAATPHPSQDEVRRVERLVQAEIGRISRLVDDLLLLAQAERADFLRPEAVDLPAFVADLWDGLSLTADRRFELGPVPDGRLNADPDRLAQALRNLARNAIEHTHDGDGLVRLDVTQLASGRIRFSVSDDGPGIPVAERERVFERFHRVDAARSRASGGAGLGLAIVLAVAEAHGGHVHAREREEGRGTQIELVLPRFTPDPPDRTGRAQAADPAPAASSTGPARAARAADAAQPPDSAQPAAADAANPPSPHTPPVRLSVHGPSVPPHNLRLPDERARLRADEGDA